MRVAVVVERYVPHAGGVEYAVASVTRALWELGVDLEIFSAEPMRAVGTTRDAGPKTTNKSSVRFVSGTRLPIGLLAQLPAGFDVVHVHNFHSLATSALRYDRGAKLVLTPYFHGRGSTRLLDALHGPYRWMLRRWLKAVDVVVCLSRHEAALFGAAFPAHAPKIVIIPAPLRRRFPTTRMGVPSRSLLCVGRLVPYKGFDLAIAALTHLPDWRLSIAGDGPDRDRLERYAASMGVASRVKFEGGVDDTALGGLMDEATCLIQMSVLESFGMTVLEALASSRPVIVASGSAPAELAEPFPEWVVDVAANDVAIAAAVKQVAARGPRAAPDMQRFEPRQVALDHLRVYAE